MRHLTIARRLGLPAAAAVLGALVATPALADVTVSPDTAVQGSGENLTFHLTNTGDQPVGTVSLELPDDTPVAEVYPLSVDDWAPKIEMRNLATPLATIHGGTPATQTASKITWLAMPGRSLAPGKATDLAVAIGPLPTLSTMRFTFATTYANGKAGPAMPASITLTPAVAGAAPAHAHGGTGTGTTTPDGQLSPDEQQALQDVLKDADRGPSVWAIGGWVVAALALAGGAVLMIRGRHRASEEEGDEPTPADEAIVAEAAPAEAAPAEAAAPADEKEPVAAGSSKWSYRG